MNSEKRKQYWSSWYSKNREHHIKMSMCREAKRRAKVYEWYNDFKKHSVCLECGQNHPACLKFHHMIPAEKEIEISIMIREGFSEKDLIIEMEKCVCLCGNCHDILHYDERKENKKPATEKIKEEPYIRKKAEKITLVCDGCGKEYVLPKHVYDRRVREGAITHNCSRKCSAKGRIPPNRKTYI